MRRLYETNKFDFQDVSTTTQYQLQDYNEVLVYAANTGAASGDVVVNDGAAGTTLATLTLAVGEEGYVAVKAEQVTDADGELEVVTPAEAVATIVRGEASYKPVTQTADNSVEV